MPGIASQLWAPPLHHSLVMVYHFVHPVNTRRYVRHGVYRKCAMENPKLRETCSSKLSGLLHNAVVDRAEASGELACGWHGEFWRRRKVIMMLPDAASIVLLMQM